MSNAWPVRMVRQLFDEPALEEMDSITSSPFGYKRTTSRRRQKEQRFIQMIKNATPALTTQGSNTNSFSESQAFLCELDTHLCSARLAGCPSSLLSFTTELCSRIQKRASYQQGSISMPIIIAINDEMIFVQGWRMSGVDRYIMDAARKASCRDSIGNVGRFK